MIDILLVDDELALLEQAKIFLEKSDENFEINTCQSAKKALDLLNDDQFDVVVSDYQMPEINGLEFLEVVREKKEMDIPFIIFTGKGREEVAMDALNLGADRYLRKGGGPKSQYEVLAESIKQELEHKETKRELKKKNITLSSIFKHLPIIVMVVDRDRRVKMINSSGLKFANKSEDEILNQRGGEALRCLNRLEDPDGCGYSEKCGECIVKNSVLDTFETGEKHYREKGTLPFEAGEREKEVSFWVTTAPLEFEEKERVLVAIEDITELENTKKRLQKHLEAMEASMDGMAILNDEEEYIYLNQTHAEIYGYNEPDELMGKTWRVLYGEEELERFETEIMPRFREKGRWRGEAVGMKKDGTKFSQEISLIELENRALICVVRDISERKQMKEKLRETKRNYQELFEKSADGLSVHDPETGDILKVNQKLCEIYGYSKEEASELTLGDLASGEPPSTQDEGRKKVRKAKVEGPQRFEWRGEKKDGTLFWAEVTLKEVEIRGETRILANVRDITERKEKEKNLGESRERLEAERERRKTLLDNIPGYALILKKDTREIVFSNEKAKEMGAVPGETCFGTIAERDDPCPFCKAPELWETEERKELEVEYKGRYYHGIWIPYTEDLYVHYVFDITERKEVEERQEFLHSLLRHDVRNKIQVAQGYLQLMEDDRVENYSEKILKALKNADSIIEKIRILEDTDGDEKKTVMELSLIVDKIISQYQPLIKENEIEIEVSEIDCKVKAGNLLVALFMNLIENSIKHANCEKILIDQEEKDDVCIIIIEDDGVGIPEKDKIFERGYKKGRYAGSGLGMYLVKEIAESYGGSVEVKDSELGGARFDVRLRKADNIS